MRNSYLRALQELAEENRNVLACVADNGAIVYDKFREKLPRQFINFGIAEANMVSAAAGLAANGKIPFLYTIIPFLTMRAYEQIRNDVCIQKMNVKLVGIGAGVVYANLGPTHHALEDIAIMRILPGMTIFSPASPQEAYLATKAAAAHDGPVYLRLGTNKEPELFDAAHCFEIGKGVFVRDGGDITLAATGSILGDVLKAAEILSLKGISACVVNLPSIKPLDVEILSSSLRRTGAMLVVEEHSIAGGLGSSILEGLAAAGALTGAIGLMGFNDTFCQGYAEHGALKAMNGLGVKDIAERAETLLARKQR
ncbi:MAG TPA: transketolase C-terminal domain-containing protein [Patescibacteria group bacterium]|nr:transketolase C-terminal domain-containing protein [Patescibacteria group bacterium]